MLRTPTIVIIIVIIFIVIIVVVVKYEEARLRQKTPRRNFSGYACSTGYLVLVTVMAVMMVIGGGSRSGRVRVYVDRCV